MKDEMKLKSNATGGGLPRWASPRAARWLNIATAPLSRHALDRGDDTVQTRGLLNSVRRIQTIGVAASSIAAAIWLFAIAWLWPILA
ncbi:MAG: hypothetical protein ABJA83_02490 [Burkholderiaceae bacterium]